MAAATLVILLELLVAREALRQLQHVQQQVDDVHVDAEGGKHVLVCAAAAGQGRRMWVGAAGQW